MADVGPLQGSIRRILVNNAPYGGGSDDAQGPARKTGRSSLLPVADAPFLPDTPTVAAEEAAAAAAASPFRPAASSTSHIPASIRHSDGAAALTSPEHPPLQLLHHTLPRVSTTARTAVPGIAAAGGSPSPRALPQPSRLTHGLAAGSRLVTQPAAAMQGPTFSPPQGTRAGLASTISAAGAGVGNCPGSPIHPGMFAPAFLVSSAPQSPVGPDASFGFPFASPGRRTSGLSAGGMGGSGAGPTDAPGSGSKGGGGKGPAPPCSDGTDLLLGHLGRLNCSAAPNVLSSSPSRRRNYSRFAAQHSGRMEPGCIDGVPMGTGRGLQPPSQATGSFRGHSTDGCGAAEQQVAIDLAGYTLAYSSVGGDFDFSTPGGAASSAALLLGTSAPSVGSPRWHLHPPSQQQQQQQRTPSPAPGSPASAAVAGVSPVMGFHPPPSQLQQQQQWTPSPARGSPAAAAAAGVSPVMGFHPPASQLQQQQQQWTPSPARGSPAAAAAAGVSPVMGFHPPPSASSSGSGPALFGAAGAAQQYRPVAETFKPDIEQYKPGLEQHKPVLSLSGRWRLPLAGGAEFSAAAAPAALEASDSIKLADSLSSFMRLQQQRPVG